MSSRTNLDSDDKGTAEVNGLIRLNRMTADLANERTMLAWTRTSLAMARTVFSALALKGITGSGTISTHIYVVALAVVALWIYCHGYGRYKRVKLVLEMPLPPRYFDRISNNPQFLAMAALCLLVVFDTALREWK